MASYSRVGEKSLSGSTIFYMYVRGDMKPGCGFCAC
jgi:hypothetical protein